MYKRKAFMFGYSSKRTFLAHQLGLNLTEFSIVVSDEESFARAKEKGYKNLYLLDVTDDEALESLEVNDNDYLICVMDDHHLNVFLTLSLHALFPKAEIVALSDSRHTSQKLKMAGASKIIDLYQVSANRIHNILHKPVTTKLIEELFNAEKEFSFREMVIPEGSKLDGVMAANFDFYPHNIILVGMIDNHLSKQFIFVTSGLENRFDSGDTLVCIGYMKDLDKFEKFMKN